MNKKAVLCRSSIKQTKNVKNERSKAFSILAIFLAIFNGVCKTSLFKKSWIFIKSVVFTLFVHNFSYSSRIIKQSLQDKWLVKRTNEERIDFSLINELWVWFGNSTRIVSHAEEKNNYNWEIKDIVLDLCCHKTECGCCNNTVKTRKKYFLSNTDLYLNFADTKKKLITAC